MRASIAAEAAGVPSVSVVCEGFEGQARATARGFGHDDLPLASTIGHVDAQTAEQMIEGFIAHTVPQVVAGLTVAMAHDDDDDGASEPAAMDIVATGTIEEINDRFHEEGWTDGLPVMPPTRTAVEAFIAPSGHDPWKRLGVATSSGRDVTIWSIAVNGVMAGCEPVHLPVLIALAQILVDPAYGAEHSGNTTGADALVIVDGPSLGELGLHHGPGALREGHRANTSIGRWLRLYLRNVLGFTAEEHDKATFGNSTRVVLCEDMEALAEIGWEPLSADFGHGAADDVAMMARMNSGLIVGSVFGAHPNEIVPYLADGLVRVSGWDLTHVFGLGKAQFKPLLVLSPVLARTIGGAGWTKPDLQTALFEQARMPAWRFEKLIGEWSNLTAGRRTLFEMVAVGDVPPVFGESDDPDRLVPIVTDASCLRIAVSGDPNRTNAYVFSNDGPHGDWTAAAIDRGFSADLLCRI